MKKKLLVLGLGICLLFTACTGQKPKETNEKETAENSQETENNGEKEKQNDSQEEPGVELTQTPEVTFTDYSQNLTDEETGTPLLAVMENCPIVSIPENEAAAEKINMVFEQKYMENQANIEKDLKAAKSAYEELSESERESWSCYETGTVYKMVYASQKILSIEMETFQKQGADYSNEWTSAYCFDVTTGKLLALTDIFTDKAEAKKIVEERISDTITKEPYKDYLMEDYENYIPDILTDVVFYLNEKGVVVICNPYMVTMKEGEIIEIEVPYKELSEVMNPVYAEP